MKEEASLEDLKTQAETDKARAEERKTLLEVEKLEEDRDWRLANPARREDSLELLFADEVDEATVQQAILTLNAWSRRWPGAPIVVIFNSPGGAVIHGLALYDYLRSLSARGHEIVTRTIGYAASMGGVLLQAGDRREAGPNAFMLIHEVSSGGRGKASSLEDNLAFTKRLQEKLLAILAHRSTLSSEEIRDRWERRDWWLDADEMVELGFADRVA